jgi:hypothetical protein
MHQDFNYAECMGADVVQHLVQCCPGLSQLDGGTVLPLLPALSSLTCLTRLSAVRVQRKEHASGLRSLTQLQEVSLTSSTSRSKWRTYDFQWLLELRSPDRIADYAVNTLKALVDLANLSGLVVTERQLQHLTNLTNLTSLTFRLTDLGFLLVPRLISLTTLWH